MNVEITGDSPSRIRTFYLALRELGLKQLGWYLVYSAGLKSGYFRWRENRSMSLKIDVPYSLNRKLFPTPVLVDLRSILKPSGEKAVLAEAEEILEGQIPSIWSKTHRFGFAATSTTAPLVHKQRE